MNSRVKAATDSFFKKIFLWILYYSLIVISFQQFYRAHCFSNNVICHHDAKHIFFTSIKSVSKKQVRVINFSIYRNICEPLGDAQLYLTCGFLPIAAITDDHKLSGLKWYKFIFLFAVLEVRSPKWIFSGIKSRDELSWLLLEAPGEKPACASWGFLVTMASLAPDCVTPLTLILSLRPLLSLLQRSLGIHRTHPGNPCNLPFSRSLTWSHLKKSLLS